MTRSYLLLLIVFVLLFFLRVQYLGGIEREKENPLSKYSLPFEPTKQYLANLSKEILPPTQAALFSGMVIGVKEDLPKDFNKALQRTSTIHMVVVSGQNLSMFAGFLLSFKGVFGRKRTIIASIVIVIFYSLLTGLQIPVLRAAIMFILASIASLLGREEDNIWIILLTAAGMLVFDPNWLLSVSFQLSFLATIGVLIVAPVVVKLFKFMPEIIREDFSVALCAQALTAPIIASTFHQFSLMGVITNTLVGWTVPLIMFSGIVTLIFSLIVPFLGQIVSLVPLSLLTFFIYIVEFFDTSWNSLYVGKISNIVWVGYYILLLGFFLFIQKKTAKTLIPA